MFLSKNLRYGTGDGRNSSSTHRIFHKGNIEEKEKKGRQKKEMTPK